MKEKNLKHLVETASGDETYGEMVQPKTPEQVIEEVSIERKYRKSVISINDFPPYVPEDQNPDILIRGRWLERGGSAWWVSTAGTGKSIASIQVALCWGAGLPFAGLEPHRPLRTWIFQSEDSPSRITIDREDVMSELRDRYPDVDWNDVGERQVKFAKIHSAVGADFIDALDELLSEAKTVDELPDVIIINPFMAFIGGPISDGSFVTPFLRGGEISGHHTPGFQAVLEKFSVAALIFHHTPKPPTEKEIDGWLKSTFPEYQGAGSSDITNWGRSFITMMKVKGHNRMVCLVAGKNGGEIGWEEIGGSRRHYLAWSDADGITGGRRHAWRELTDDERSEILGESVKDFDDESRVVRDTIIDALRNGPAMKRSEIENVFKGRFRRAVVRAAANELFENPSGFRLTIKPILCGGKSWGQFIGFADGIRMAEKMEEQKTRIEKTFEGDNGESNESQEDRDYPF